MDMHAQFLFWLVLREVSAVHSVQQLLKVTIVTPGYTGFVTLPSLNYIGPAIDTAMDHMIKTYRQILDFTHIYLSDTNFGTCVSFADNVQHLVAAWYYNYTSRQTENSTEIIVFVTSACTESVKLSQLAASWNILLITRYFMHMIIVHYQRSILLI